MSREVFCSYCVYYKPPWEVIQSECNHPDNIETFIKKKTYSLPERQGTFHKRHPAKINRRNDCPWYTGMDGGHE